MSTRRQNLLDVSGQANDPSLLHHGTLSRLSVMRAGYEPQLPGWYYWGSCRLRILRLLEHKSISTKRLRCSCKLNKPIETRRESAAWQPCCRFWRRDCRRMHLGWAASSSSGPNCSNETSTLDDVPAWGILGPRGRRLLVLVVVLGAFVGPLTASYKAILLSFSCFRCILALLRSALPICTSGRPSLPQHP